MSSGGTDENDETNARSSEYSSGLPPEYSINDGNEDEVVKPPGRIRTGVRDYFKDDIQQRYGMVRGRLGDDMEEAMIHHVKRMNGNTTDVRLRNIEERLDEIEHRTSTISDVIETANSKIDALFQLVGGGDSGDGGDDSR